MHNHAFSLATENSLYVLHPNSTSLLLQSDYIDTFTFDGNVLPVSPYIHPIHCAFFNLAENFFLCYRICKFLSFRKTFSFWYFIKWQAFYSKSTSSRSTSNFPKTGYICFPCVEIMIIYDHILLLPFCTFLQASEFFFWGLLCYKC